MQVELGSWRAECESRQSEGLAILCAVDHKSYVELWLRTESGSVLTTRVENGDVVESIAEVWPVAVFREREIHEGFGILFSADSSHIPWVIASDSPMRGVAYLRKSVGLRSRHEIDWPGLKDPTDASSSPSRRRTLPIGVQSDSEKLV